jgi:hypothetical protein
MTGDQGCIFRPVGLVSRLEFTTSCSFTSARSPLCVFARMSTMRRPDFQGRGVISNDISPSLLRVGYAAAEGGSCCNVLHGCFHGLTRQPLFDRVLVRVAFESIQAVSRTKPVVRPVIFPAVPAIWVNGHSANRIVRGYCAPVSAVRWISISSISATVASVRHAATAVTHHDVEQAGINENRQYSSHNDSPSVDAQGVRLNPPCNSYRCISVSAQKSGNRGIPSWIASKKRQAVQ